MRISIELVAVALVVLVVAAVAIIMFGNTAKNASSLSDLRNYCDNIGSSSCKAVNALPPNWYAKNLKYGKSEQLVSCSDIATCNDCQCYLGKNKKTK